MSFFTPEGEETCSEAANKVFDSLLEEITRVEAELGGLRGHLRNQPVGASEAAVAAQEVEGWKGEKVEGLPEDPEIRYYLAVGKLEKQLEEMRQAKELAEQRSAARAERQRVLGAQLQEQGAMVSKLEAEVEVAGAGDSNKEGNLVARRELSSRVRQNKMLLTELKNSLKMFIDVTATLEEGHDPLEGSNYGYLLQALWKSFLSNGVMEYISIQDQEFDVPPAVLHHLIQAGIVKVHPTDTDRVRMEDFTCTD